jgi:hypothetical protein
MTKHFFGALSAMCVLSLASLGAAAPVSDPLAEYMIGADDCGADICGPFDVTLVLPAVIDPSISRGNYVRIVSITPVVLKSIVINGKCRRLIGKTFTPGASFEIREVDPEDLKQFPGVYKSDVAVSASCGEFQKIELNTSSEDGNRTFYFRVAQW